MRIFLTISIFLLSCSNDTKTWKEYYNNGLKKHKNGDYYGAIDDYSKSIELNSNFVYAYWLRGVAKEIMNDRKDACTDYKISAEMGHKGAKEIIWDDHCK